MTELSSNISKPFSNHLSKLSNDTYDDNKDIIWPAAVGVFVSLALGWMICRYKCSSKERSPYSVRCCPKSLCKYIRLCCVHTFRSRTQQQTNLESRNLSNNKSRTSAISLQDVPFLIDNLSVNRPSLAQVSQQWPPSFILDQSPSFPLSIAVQSTAVISQPKRHPLRRDSTFIGINNERRESSLWPFRTVNAIFHKQTSEIKENNLFLSS